MPVFLSICKMGITILAHSEVYWKAELVKICKNHKSKYVNVQIVRTNIIQYWMYPTIT